jgi:hypothetical protein
MSWHAVIGDHGKEPDDWQEQCNKSLLRMAGKAQFWDITPSHCFQADQTYVYFKPAAAYVQLHSIANVTPQCRALCWNIELTDVRNVAK